MKNTRFQIIRQFSWPALMGLYAFTVKSILETGSFVEFLAGDKGFIQKIVFTLCLIYILGYALLLRGMEAFKVGHRRIMDLAYGHFVTAIIINGCLTLVLWVLMEEPFFYLICMWAGLTLGESILGLLWILLLHRIYERPHFHKEALFIYGKKEDPTEYRRMGYTLNRYFRASKEAEYSVGMEALKALIGESEIVFIGDIPTQLRNQLLKYCMQEKRECYCLPKVSDVYIQSATVRQLHDKLLLALPVIGMKPGVRLIKRSMDLVLSGILLLLAAPFMLVIALAIKLDDGGPVLYRQKRVTEGGREFQILKFRSMRMDAEQEEITLARKDDERITRVGRFIRNIHFDELPQLINVLKGDMSLVGPRPERREFIEAYSLVIPEFSERLKVKGGLTGYAQVYGKYNTEPEDKIKYDLYYIYNHSIGLDIKLLLLTVRILFQSENTEGIDEGQSNALKPWNIWKEEK